MKYVAIANKLNVLAYPRVKFLCFATFILKFFVAETKKSNQFEFFLFLQQKSYVPSEET